MSLSEDLDKELLKTCFAALWPLHTFASQNFVCTEKDTVARKNWWKTQADNLLDQVEQGAPVGAEDIPYPELFVWRLRERYGDVNGMNVRQRTVAILGLAEWFRACILRHADLEDVFRVT